MVYGLTTMMAREYNESRNKTESSNIHYNLHDLGYLSDRSPNHLGAPNTHEEN